MENTKHVDRHMYTENPEHDTNPNTNGIDPYPWLDPEDSRKYMNDADIS